MFFLLLLFFNNRSVCVPMLSFECFVNQGGLEVYANTIFFFNAFNVLNVFKTTITFVHLFTYLFLFWIFMEVHSFGELVN